MAADSAQQTTKDGYVISYENRDSPPSAFNGPPTATMQTSWEQLTTMEKETFTKIIYGNEPLEAYDAFVQNWYAKGGTQITEEVNEWYAGTNTKDAMTRMGLE